MWDEPKELLCFFFLEWLMRVFNNCWTSSATRLLFRLFNFGTLLSTVRLLLLFTFIVPFLVNLDYYNILLARRVERVERVSFTSSWAENEQKKNCEWMNAVPISSMCETLTVPHLWIHYKTTTRHTLTHIITFAFFFFFFSSPAMNAYNQLFFINSILIASQHCRQSNKHTAIHSCPFIQRCLYLFVFVFCWAFSLASTAQVSMCSTHAYKYYSGGINE